MTFHNSYVSDNEILVVEQIYFELKIRWKLSPADDQKHEGMIFYNIW